MRAQEKCINERKKEKKRWWVQNERWPTNSWTTDPATTRDQTSALSYTCLRGRKHTHEKLGPGGEERKKSFSEKYTPHTLGTPILILTHTRTHTRTRAPTHKHEKDAAPPGGERARGKEDVGEAEHKEKWEGLWRSNIDTGQGFSLVYEKNTWMFENPCIIIILRGKEFGTNIETDSRLRNPTNSKSSSQSQPGSLFFFFLGLSELTNPTRYCQTKRKRERREGWNDGKEVEENRFEKNVGKRRQEKALDHQHVRNRAHSFERAAFSLSSESCKPSTSNQEEKRRAEQDKGLLHL